MADYERTPTQAAARMLGAQLKNLVMRELK